MKKAGLILFFLLVVGVVAAIGIQSLSPGDISWLGSSTLYEYTSKALTIYFDSQSSSLIQANVTVSGATIVEVLNPSGCGVVGQLITCNRDFDTLKVNITANDVASDAAAAWNITVIDSVSGRVDTTLDITVQNDALAPTYVLNAPANYTMVKNENTLFNLSITETQSGLGNTGIVYDWGATPSPSVVTSNMAMQESGGYYLATVNMESGDTAKNYFGFYFNLTDLAGNVNAQLWHYVYVDRVAPTVALSTPLDGTIVSNYSYGYSFAVADNAFGIDTHFSPQVSCGLYIDSSLKNTGIESSNASLSLGASLLGLADGSHSWYVTCTDSAGWSTSSAARTFILDTTGPLITLTTPANNSVIANGTQIQLDVTDSLSNVSAVWYSLDGGVTSTLLGVAPYAIDSALFATGSNTVTVYANDTNANPSQTAFTFQVDVVAPTIVLTHPTDFNYSNGIFMANATDNYAAALQCSLRVDGTVRETKSTGNGQNLSYTLALADGTYTWDVNCTDGVLLQADAVDRTLVVDTTAPSVTLVSPLNVAGYDLNNANTNGVSDFTYNIVEEHHDLCTLYINSTQQTQVVSGANFSLVDFTALGSRNSAYDWYVQCADAAGNSVASSIGYVYFDQATPHISGLSSGSITTATAVLSWNTDEEANATVYYGTNSSDLSALVKGMANTSAYLPVDSLSASTVYVYIAQSCDQFNQCVNSSVENFTTIAAPSSPSGGGGGGGGGGSLTCGVGFVKVNGICVPEVVNTTVSAATEVSTEPVAPPVGEVAETAAVEEAVLPSEPEAPLGVGQATGLFGRVAGNWELLAGAGAVLALLAVLWKTQVLGSLFHRMAEYRAMKGRKEEELVREKLRKQGLIK